MNQEICDGLPSPNKCSIGGNGNVVPVYDIRNCGPRHRFWANGKLVHNSNWQNWTNGSEINQGVLAPEGFEIWEPDASQIECRLLNYCAGQHDKIEEFRQGLDPYVSVASKFYGVPVYKPKAGDPNYDLMNIMRQLGKIVELQAGYMSGGEKIRQTVRIKSGGKILLTAEEGVQARDAYRETHPAVVRYWRTADWLLTEMYNWHSHDWGPLRVVCEWQTRKRRIVLPNGIELIYDTLEWFVDQSNGDEYWRLKTRRGWAKMYSGKLVENVIQALARVVVSQAMLRLKRLGYRCKNTKHDSLWLLVPKDGRREHHESVILGEMSRSPSWLPDIPLSAEFKHQGERYA